MERVPLKLRQEWNSPALLSVYNLLSLFQDPHSSSLYYFLVSLFYTFLTLRLLMSYIYGAPILDVSRSHTTTQHSR